MKRILPVLLVLLLIVSALLPVTGAATTTVGSHQNTEFSPACDRTVSVQTASSIASLKINEIAGNIPGFENWQKGDVEFSTTYYDLEGAPSAYSFDILVNGQRFGYILISATRNNYPILEFSKGFTPDKYPALMMCSSDLANSFAEKLELKPGDAKLLYLGATFYYAEFPLTDCEGIKQDSVIIDLTTPSVIDEFPTKIPVTDEFMRQQQTKQNEIKALWDALDDQMRASGPTTVAESATGTSGYVNGVPTYLWQRGCSPTASAMVLGYWDSHGYPNFPEEAPLIQELAIAMGTTTEGSTWPWDIDDGIDEVCANHGYSSMDSSDDAWMTFDEVKSGVDAQRPFVLSMWSGGTPVGGDRPYGDHSVAAAGYHDYTEDWVSVHDTWDTQIHNIVYGNWWGAMATWVRP
jgi:hypothetical protein